MKLTLTITILTLLITTFLIMGHNSTELGNNQTIVYASIYSKENKSNELLQALNEGKIFALAESEVIQFDILQDENDSNHIIIVEYFKNKTDHQYLMKKIKENGLLKDASQFMREPLKLKYMLSK